MNFFSRDNCKHTHIRISKGKKVTHYTMSMPNNLKTSAICAKIQHDVISAQCLMRMRIVSNQGLKCTYGCNRRTITPLSKTAFVNIPLNANVGLS